MSKDGDWILREDVEATQHVLAVLAARGARYRFGAPLDVAWLTGGWSAHLEFSCDGLRVRTDFFTRPPRVTPSSLARMWRDAEGVELPFTDARILAEMKKTERLRDYAVIGELARIVRDPRDQLLLSRSASDLLELASAHPDLVASLVVDRPLLGRLGEGARAVAEALQLEMLDLWEADRRCLAVYRAAAAPWAERWSEVVRELDALPLAAAHARMVELASAHLPRSVGPQP